jgi:hypothetical protein
LVFLLKAPLVWGFSVERTRLYVKNALAAKLDEDSQWLRLGHYHRHLWGSYHSKIKGSFFINPDGADDPKAELVSTIEALFSDSVKKPPQCRYLARTHWLREKLAISAEDIVACPAREAWKKNLNAQEAYLIFASNDLNSAASSFGHTFIRLHNPENHGSLDLIDYGVNFAAQTDDNDGILFALKGLFGLYPGFYSMLPYHQKLREYINLEGRDIWEYRMDLTPAQVDFMIDHLLELEGSYMPYFFVDDNCSYEILELIEVVRPDLDLTSHFVDATIPLDTLKILARQKDFLGPGRERPSLRAEFEKIYAHLDSREKERLVSIVKEVKASPKPPPEDASIWQERDPLVLDASLNYLAIQEYRNQKDFKDWKYKLSVTRARLGGSEEISSPAPKSPMNSPDSSAFYLSYGSVGGQAASRFKYRRAFHDLISRDEGVSPFSHVEVLGAQFQYEYEKQRLDLVDLQLLKIISSNPVTRLDHPLSWTTNLGTEPKLSPFFEGGMGYSIDFPIGENSRWMNFLMGRAFERENRGRLGLGLQSLFVQKLTDRLRTLEAFKYYGVFADRPFISAQAALSYDWNLRWESRLSYEKSFDQDIFMLSFIF